MTKIVISKRNPKHGKRAVIVPLKKFLSASGKITKIPTLDSEDPEFGLKLETVFKRNVDRALKASKKIKAVRRAAGKNR